MKHAVCNLRVLAAVSVCMLPGGCGGGSTPIPTPVLRPADDPRLTYATPYKNVRPEVKYVGDKLCASCHATQSDSYRHHPMGRSLAPSSGWVGHERFDPAARNPFTAGGFEFSASQRDGTLVHTESRRDAQGQILTTMAADVHYVVGSGEHGYSYLIERNGYLFQSPLTWYTQKHAWDLSPGFTADMHADRQIQAGCIVCHCNQAEPVPGTINRYRTPVFRGYAIGCERCHGPGELHVASREAGQVVEGRDYTIVNPRHLAPALRDAVCEQCHLSGEARVLRRNREEFDFRPGLPFYLFVSIYVKRPGFTDEEKSVNHVQQMVESRCYLGSKGALGCISCHDPHTMPARDQTAAYFRERCLKCHADRTCSLPLPRRQENQNCIACHMPPFASTDIAHTAFTDHRILRQPAGQARAAKQPNMLRPGELPIVHFHEALLELAPEESARDRGVALVTLARRYPPAQRVLGRSALPLLEAATELWPDDSAAAEAHAFALWLGGESGNALAAYQELLRREPERETALVDAASLSASAGQNEEAIDYLQRALKIDPWATRSHHQLAALLAENGRWPAALEECQAVLRLNPASPESRLLVVRGLLQTGERERARAELEKLLALGVPDPAKLRQWFAGQIR